MSDQRMWSKEHFDAQDDRMVISAYANIGTGPAVVFDGGGFTDPETLRAFAADLASAADWLAEEVRYGVPFGGGVD